MRREADKRVESETRAVLLLYAQRKAAALYELDGLDDGVSTIVLAPWWSRRQDESRTRAKQSNVMFNSDTCL